jgi:hypothetical protein
MNLHQYFSLLVLRIDSLIDRDQPHAGEVQSLVDCERVLRFAGESARVVHEQNVEWAWSLLQRSEKPLKAWAVIGRPGDGRLRGFLARGQRCRDQLVSRQAR